jgi:Family of unknown function (DUF6521)
MIPEWKNRPEITAHLNNPAFCSEIIRECVIGYNGESNRKFPFALSFLVLPIILNSKIRDRLPSNKSNNVHRWINENEDLKIGLSSSITSFIPFTKESIMFAITHDSLEIDEVGNIEIKPRKGRLKMDNDEIKNCVAKATVMGKIFSKSGNPFTIFAMLGIKP